METNNIPRGTLQIASSHIIQYAVAALFYMIVAKTNLLTQTDIGKLSILTFLASTFSLFTMLALPAALTKFTAEKLGQNQQEQAASIQKTITRIVLILSSVGLAIIILLSPTLSQHFWQTPTHAPLIIFTVINAFISNVITLTNFTLRALYLFGKIATVTVTSTLVSRVTAILLSQLGLGLQGVLAGYITGSLAAIIPGIYFLHGKLPYTKAPAPVRPIIHFSLPLLLSATTTLIMNWADVVILNYLQGASTTGIYYITIKSIGVISILTLPITTTIFPALSARYGTSNPEGVASILQTTSRYLIYLIVPTCVGLAAISPTALTFFYGPNYTEGSLPLSILSIGTLILALKSLLDTALTAIGQTRQILTINLTAALTTIICLLAFVPHLQVTGAALARLTTQIATLILAFYLLHKKITIKLDEEALWKSTAASLGTVPLLLVLQSALTPRLSTTQSLITQLFAAVTIYAIILYILKALKKQDFQLLRQALPEPASKYINILQKILAR